MVTPLYAGILGLVMIALSINVVRNRRRAKVSLGDGGNPTLQRAIRAHGNLVEYAPWILLLMTLVELQGASPYILHIQGSLLVIGRVSHLLAILGQRFPPRVFGMLLTYGVTFWLCVQGIGNALMR